MKIEAPLAASAVPNTDPLAAAKAAGLRYVHDDRPGIRREAGGDGQAARGGFRYVDAHGAPVEDDATLKRIKSLAIPPAWVDVWICPQANGHLQATGATRAGASSTATTPDGARYATRSSTSA